jgi:hypothetical protein
MTSRNVCGATAPHRTRPPGCRSTSLGRGSRITRDEEVWARAARAQGPAGGVAPIVSGLFLDAWRGAVVNGGRLRSTCRCFQRENDRSCAPNHLGRARRRRAMANVELCREDGPYGGSIGGGNIVSLEGKLPDDLVCVPRSASSSYLGVVGPDSRYPSAARVQDRPWTSGDGGAINRVLGWAARVSLPASDEKEAPTVA